MTIEKPNNNTDTSREDPRIKIREYVRDSIQASIEAGKPRHIGAVRDSVISGYCAENDIDPATARGLNHLVKKFDRVRKPEHLEQLLTFGVWLRDNVPRNFYGRGSMVYLANQDASLQNVLENICANYTYWTQVFGPKIFETSHDTISPREGIWKSWLPLPGYYLSLKGGSGSGTFSVDLALGYDHKHMDHPEPLHDTAGEMWRLGFDLEVSGEKEKIFRIIRTGSGHKSQKDENREVQLNAIRKNFLNAYKTPPHRLLPFLALEIAYTLKFDKAKALSTEGAMKISLLGQSKRPVDYTASMTGAGFEYKEGNWHEINNLQEDYYDILAGAGYEDALRPHEVKGFGMILDAFNMLRHAESGELPLKLVRGEPEELEKAWDAFARLRTQEHERRNLSDVAPKNLKK